LPSKNDDHDARDERTAEVDSEICDRVAALKVARPEQNQLGEPGAPSIALRARR